MIDDVVARPRQLPTFSAFSRVVCVPWASQCPLVFRGALERQVRRSVHEYKTAYGGTPSDLLYMAEFLREKGLEVVVVSPALGSSTLSPLTTKQAVNAPFLVVSAAALDETVQKGSDDFMVIDASLRELLAVAPATDSYTRSLGTNVPELFIGSLSRLRELVSAMASQIASNFAVQGVDVPPWRRTSALLNRWTNLEQRVQVQHAVDTQLRHASEQQQQLFEVDTGAMADGCMAQDSSQCGGEWDEVRRALMLSSGCGSMLSTLTSADGSITGGCSGTVTPARVSTDAGAGKPVFSGYPGDEAAMRESNKVPAAGGGAGGAARGDSFCQGSGVQRASSEPSIVIVGFNVTGSSSGMSVTALSSCNDGHVAAAWGAREQVVRLQSDGGSPLGLGLSAIGFGRISDRE